MIVKPSKPQLPAQLDEWDGKIELETEIDRAGVAEADFTSSKRLIIEASRLVAVTLTAASLEKLECSDVAGSKIEAAGLYAYKAEFLRTVWTDCRLSGAEFAEGKFTDCTFKNVKFDQVGFRFANFQRVRFENCNVKQADFSSATFRHVTFAGCDINESNFVSADCHNVDISGMDLWGVKGVLGLKGSFISEEQLLQLAPLLAAELGFHVKKES